MTITRTLTAALAIAALAVPAAQAQPPDMHASVALAAAKARQAQEAKQDLRSPDARDAAVREITQDLRSPDTRDAAVHPRGTGHAVNAPGATAVDSATRPDPIAPAPAAKVGNPGDGIDWTTIALGVAGSLLAIGALAVLNSRRTQRLRVTA